MSVDGLYKCPICGGDPVMFHTMSCDEAGNPRPVYGVRCKKCAVSTMHMLTTEDYARANWNMRVSNNIKPCPFCGNGNCVASFHTIETENEWIEDMWYVECYRCFAHTDKKRYKTENEAIEAWNKRCK